MPPTDFCRPVYRGLTRAEIARQYNPTVAVPDHATFTAAKRQRSAEVLAALPGPRDVRYGPDDRQRLDIFPAGEGAPTLLYLHGGAWRMLDRRDYAFVAEPWVARGVTVVLPSYGRLPASPLPALMRHAREAALWTSRTIAAHGGDPARLHLAGTSAGAHLLALAVHDAEVADSVRSLTIASGVYDFEAHRWHPRHRDMRLDDGLVRRASPIHNPPARADLPVIAAVGLDETPEMIRQTRDFHAQLRGRGHPTDLIEAPGNHFKVGAWFGEPDHPLFKRMVREVL